MIGMMMAAAAAVATPVAPVQVMVLGSYHFDNPGRDVVNIKADDVRTLKRQRELAALAEAIAKFRPTRVMVERQRPGPDYDVKEYAAFAPAVLTKDPDETVQLGFRIAARAGLKSVQGIDEQPQGDEPDYFPFDKVQAYAKDKGEAARLDAVFAPLKEAAKAAEARMGRQTIPQLLVPYNDETSPMAGQQVSYGMLAFGDGDKQPGADLNAMWYLRNAKIFAKLMNVATPGDRVLVVYGAGHGYWLRHFAATVPGYVSVDVKPYLKRAAAAVR
ncbi:DUF5694 domain-containing protein [Sphingomonas sp. GB1N7]|uniref:DUF5694 domain-containing protein n=1 Tax=Parasphingomonas caseinilytica TaxID=3096158 RepID=UPI002FC99C6C